MNNPQYNMLQTSRPTQNSDSYIAGLLALGGILWLIPFIIFVLWVWSMISVISLNKKFKEFLEEYSRNEAHTLSEVTNPSDEKATKVDGVQSDSAEVDHAPSRRSDLIPHPALIALLAVTFIVLVGILILNAVS